MALAFTLFSLNLFGGCFSEEFTTGDSEPDSGDAGTDSMTDSGTEGGTDSSTDTGSEDAGTDTGTDSETDSGTDSGTDTGTDTDSGGPCANGLLAEDVQADLGAGTCQELFGAGLCGTNVGLTRGELAVGIAAYLEANNYLTGYTEPNPPIYPDDPNLNPNGAIYDAVAKGTWAYVISDQGLTYDPNDPAACSWWDNELLPAIQDLPDFYSLVNYAPPDVLPPTWTGARSLTHTIYRSSPGNHFSQTVRVVNDPQGNFLVPVAEDAIASITLECDDAEGVGKTSYGPTVPVGGEASFNVDCYDQSGDGFELTIYFNVASQANGANTNDQIRLSTHPDDVITWHVIGNNSEVPLFTVQ